MNVGDHEVSGVNDFILLGHFDLVEIELRLGGHADPVFNSRSLCWARHALGD